MVHTKAELHLDFQLQDYQTILRIHKQEPPLRVVRAFPVAASMTEAKLPSQHQNGYHLNTNGNGHLANDNGHSANGNGSHPEQPYGAALVHLHNVSGGVLGGDQLGLRVNVGPKAQAQLTSTGSTRVYRHREDRPTTTQSTHLTVEKGGLLEYLPDTLIPYAHSQYRQQTRIDLENGAGLFYWEVITSGREAKGECFEYDLLQIELDIAADGVPIAIERCRLEPKKFTPSPHLAQQAWQDSLVRLESCRYFATFYICFVGLSKSFWLDLESDLDKMARSITKEQNSGPDRSVWGVSTLPEHGLSVRAVGTSSHAIQRALPRFWQLAKAQIYHQNAVIPRKIY